MSPRQTSASQTDKEVKVGTPATIEIPPIKTQIVDFNLLGVEPLFYNMVAEKARRELLFPAIKTPGKKKDTLKHEPMREFQNSVYYVSGEDEPSYLAAPSEWFHAAMCNAATDIEGVAKAQLNRLTSVLGHRVHIYGTPVLSTRVVRMADQKRTPDIRIAACLPRWACTIRIRYIKPNVTPMALVNLLAMAGFTVGVGDWRQQKGSGNKGQFALVDEKDKKMVKEFKRLVEFEGRVVQLDAMKKPGFFDDESQRLVGWFYQELKRRKAAGLIAEDASLEIPEELMAALSDGLGDLQVPVTEEPDTAEAVA